MINVLISGAYGKMGMVVAQYAAAAADDFTVVAGVDLYTNEDVKLSYPVYPSLSEVREVQNIDVIIDFTNASALPGLCDFARAHNIPLVACSTGYGEDDQRLLDALAGDVPVFQSANMSLGINLMIDFLQKAALFFGEAVDIEIIEKHHNTKVDAPSGTALAMAAAINEVEEKEFVFGRRTTAQKRRKNELGIHAVRGGTLVGEHEAMFIGIDEVFSVSHSAQSRRIYAAGALKAAAYIQGRPPKRYNMKDLLLENSSVTHMYIDNDVSMVSVFSIPPGQMAKLFSSIADCRVNVDMISQAAPKGGVIDVSFTLPAKDLAKALEAAGTLGLESSAAVRVVKLTVEGLGMERQAGVAARVFDVLAKQDISVHLITTSETKIALCIDEDAADMAAKTLKEAFNL